MNIENAKTLVSQLERLPDEKFWMANYIVHPEEFSDIGISRSEACGTVGCIAGWASMLNGGGENHPERWAADWLDLDAHDSIRLFYGWFARKKVDGGRIRRIRPLEDVTRSEAIAELRRLIAEAEAA